MKDLNYVIGRLQGLNELVKILKDLVDKKKGEDSEIVAVITDHVSEQLDSILGEFDGLDVKPEHKEALLELKQKHAETEPVETPEQAPVQNPEKGEQEASPDSKGKLENHEKTVDDLLRDLEGMKS